jgi:hypothetical protein
MTSAQPRRERAAVCVVVVVIDNVSLAAAVVERVTVDGLKIHAA